jgi:tRNA modification GTPase
MMARDRREMPATWSIQTPPTPGAVAIFQLCAGSPRELEEAAATAGIAPVAAGWVGLRDLLGIDRGLVARWSDTSMHLMPHGGPAVIQAMAAALIAKGIPEAAAPDPASIYPEARSPLEARMLAAVARAASPLAIDLLLDQPRRWAENSDPSPWSKVLNRLIEPPLVAAIGPPNIGKSSLANALAGRTVALVADEPGTTRDHVGVRIEMAGLVVRYVDTPGVRAAADPIETEAADLAARVVASADLILRCGDLTGPPPLPPMTPAGALTLVVATRADRGLPSWEFDAAVSALDGRGLPGLVAAIRDRLMPPEALADPRPWRFWT